MSDLATNIGDYRAISKVIYQLILGMGDVLVGKDSWRGLGVEPRENTLFNI